jgi:hypothetical protein
LIAGWNQIARFFAPASTACESTVNWLDSGSVYYLSMADINTRAGGGRRHRIAGAEVASMTPNNMRLLVCTALTLLCVPTQAQSQRIRYGPGVCGPLDPTFTKVAIGTGGQPYPMSPEELGTSPGVMDAPFFKQVILWASAEREHSYVIPVDSTVRRMRLAGTFDGTGGSVTLIDPSGNVVRQSDGVQDSSLNCGRIIVVGAPAAGNWQVRVGPTNRFWFTVQAESDLSLTVAEFVEPDLRSESNRLVRIQGQPIAGRAATLRVSLSSPIENAEFQLVSLDAQPIQTLDLRSTDSREFSGTIDIPREAFRVIMNGRDASGLTVQRSWSHPFHGEPIEIVPPADETVAAGTVRAVNFMIRNHGPAVRVSLVAVDGRGEVVAVDPPALDLAADMEGVATVRLHVPADAPPGREASIRLTATSDATAVVGGYNSAAKTFRVVRE